MFENSSLVKQVKESYNGEGSGGEVFDFSNAHGGAHKAGEELLALLCQFIAALFKLNLAELEAALSV